MQWHWHGAAKAEIADLRVQLNEAERAKERARLDLELSTRKLAHRRLSFDDRIMQIGKMN